MTLFTKAVIVAFLSVGSGVSVAQVQVPQSGVTSGSFIHETTVTRGTPDYERVRQFITEHAGPRYRSGIDSETALAATIKVTAKVQVPAQSGYEPMMVPSPPMSPPMGTYQVGDTYTFTYTSGGKTESWTFVWGGKDWQLTDYHFHVGKVPA